MKRKGVILLFTLFILVGLSGLAFALLTMLSAEIRSVNAGYNTMRAFYIADAGRDKARWALTTGGMSPGWNETASFGGGTYTVTTAVVGLNVTITSTGYIPTSSNPVATRTVVEKNALISGGGSGTNLSLTATAIASSTGGGNAASRAIDGNASTYWQSAVNGSSWLRLDYGSAKTVNKIIVTGSLITTCTVQYSTDTIIWTAVSNPSGTVPGTQTFTAVSARYLRLSITGNKPRVIEFQSYNTDHPTLGRGSFVTSG
jgi:hypothetical protein